MALEFKVNEKLLPEQMAEVFRLSGLKRPHSDLDRMGKMIDQADVLISCWDGGRVVGVARAITDYCYCCYLSDLAVIQDYQKKNIGKSLIELLQQTLGDQVSIVLLSSEQALTFYPQVGFEQANNAFRIARKL
ncbi:MULTISPECIES: GNAT family N-acetyltransferase [unclassified Paenibacillus]|uniref:GNAT family N-acetyltransferase n=1 Tax=unclassified Paenibacillus TaxID=185978 RepID=UPI0003E2212A|nr:MULTISPECIES: GNAT family N-acetyltransferase [unclassified Paenibacillus]ETT55093.1 N-acetyltransferase GCN5 [Paenibacillus sp. FSL R7-269]OMF98087.1 GNAT family N-acetyltransferase [Paenibacillus sp. FSL R7-0337]